MQCTNQRYRFNGWYVRLYDLVWAACASPTLTDQQHFLHKAQQLVSKKAWTSPTQGLENRIREVYVTAEKDYRSYIQQVSK